MLIQLGKSPQLDRFVFSVDLLFLKILNSVSLFSYIDDTFGIFAKNGCERQVKALGLFLGSTTSIDLIRALS